MASSTTGLDKKTSSALCYVLGPVTGVIFFMLEKDDEIRFHAAQSVLVFGGLFLVEFVLGLTFILAFLIPLLSLVGFVLWFVLIYKTWSGETYVVPVLGEYAQKFVKQSK